jgi:branched-chain amino acid transport system substrate-binding protein
MAPAETYYAGVLRAVHAAQPECRRVSLLHSSTGFGHEVAVGAAVSSRELGLDLSTVSYARGQVAAAAETLPAGDILLVVGIFEDELAAARILLDRPWRAAAFVGAGVEEVLAPLGLKREGLLGPAQWVARVAQAPEEGPDAQWFVSAFRHAVNTDPAYPAAAAFAAGVLAARCVREADSANDVGVLSAAAGLVVRTLRLAVLFET